MRIRRNALLCAAMLAILASAAPGAAQLVNDYPTAARADYVFGCMKVNGETREALEKCSCSIDIIASILPYERYESAEAFMGVGQIAGDKGLLFRQSEPAKKATDDLHRARAEAEIRCF
ncbi:MAG: hypothetical protein ACT4SY_10485 [Hyphomicrobiales bacterium]